jgi:hypothetical protein
MLALKLTLAPALVTGVTLANRRWGTHVGGLLAGLPIVGGPILFLVALEQGKSFAARTAIATSAGLAATVAFCVVYAWAARRLRWPVTLAVAWAMTFAGLWLLGHFTFQLAGATGFALLALTAGLAIMPRAATDTPNAARPPWWDLPLRAAMTLGLVVAVTSSARLLGPRWTGLLTPFPIATSVLAVFTHAQTGTATRLLRGLMAGFYGFIAFTTTVAVAVERWGIGPAFGLGVALAVVVNATLFTVQNRRPPVTSQSG